MKEILVVGHQNPDTDSIASALSYAHLLREMGMDAKAVALGDVSEETQFALDRFGFDAPEIIERAGGLCEKIALVDHNEFQQSVEDIDDLEIYSVVDHHKIGNFQTATALYYRAEPLGCTCSIIAKLYREKGFDIPRDMAGLMLSAIISDTLLFASPTATKEDEEIANDLSKIADIDINEYGMDLLRAGADVSKKSALEILEGDSKTYEFEDYSFRVGQVNVVDLNDVLARKEEIIETMEDVIVEEGYTTYLLVVTDILESNSIGLIRGSEAEEIAEIFNSRLEGHQIKMDGIVSRKKQVVPPITERFS